MDFVGTYGSQWELTLNPETLTYDELMGIIADASVHERASAVIPEGDSIDLPSFVLSDFRSIDLPFQETYCAFCAETEAASPTPVVPALRPSEIIWQGGRW